MYTIRVMTFNIRGFFHAQDGVNVWDNRAELNVKTIKRYAPDLIGFQELQSGNLETYQDQLPDYEYILGPKTNNEEPYNYNAIFWHSSQFELIDSGGFWLSKTPDRNSLDWGAKYIRAATWVKLRYAKTRADFLHVNTHLDHISELARVEGSRVIIQKMSQLQANSFPLILTGDFNCNPWSPVYSIFMESGFVDTYLTVGHENSEASNTHHAFEGERYSASGWRLDFWRIDWILTRDSVQSIRTKSCLIVRDQEPPLYPSDHYPVFSELMLGY